MRSPLLSFIRAILPLIQHIPHGLRLPLILGLLLIPLGYYSLEVFYARPRATYQGLPITQSWVPAYWTRIFRNEGFMVGYAEIQASPLWVVYHLSPPPEGAKSQPRPTHFSTDWRSLRRVQQEDYTGSGYDRGHLAPNYAISVLYGRPAQLATFNMTNITPQKPALNRKVWQRLEEIEINHFSRWFQSVWVFTGPIYPTRPEYLPNTTIPIPAAFYKIFVQPPQTPQQTTPRTLAFIIPQTVQGRESLSQFVTTIDQIEQETQLDFLSNLPDDIENAIEAEQKPAEWRLETVANLPSRY